MSTPFPSAPPRFPSPTDLDRMLATVDDEAEIESFRGILTPGHQIGPNEQANRALDAGFHPLSRSVELRNLPLLQALLDAGLDTSKTDMAGRTPLHEAALHDLKEAVPLLIERGADVNAQDNLHSTPLHLAASCKQLAVARALVEAGSDVNAVTTMDYTPLSVAVMSANGDASVVDFLLANKATPCEVLVGAKKSPLMHAADKGDVVCGLRLIAAGADVHQANENDWQAIHSAAYRGHTAFSDMLIAHGVSIDAKTIQGRTPLLLAMQENQFAHPLHLIESGADVHVCSDSDGDTALHIAAQKNQRELGMALLERGADLDRPDKFNTSALKTAKAVGNDDWVEQMQAFVASMRARKALDAIFSATTPGVDRARSMAP
jgi:uncharacterized protein